MPVSLRHVWRFRLDKFSAITAALIPAGLVVGNVGFEILIGVSVLGWSIRCVLAKENPFSDLIKHPLVIPWSVWYLTIVVSLCFNGPGNKGWAHDMVFIRYVLFGLALLDISKRLPVAKYLLYGLAGGVIWAALNTLSAYVLGYDFIGKDIIRYIGKQKEASRISGLASYAAAFFLSWSILDDKLSARNKAIVFAIGLIASGQLLQTHGRTAIIASVSGLLFSLTFFIRKRVPIWVAVTFPSCVLLTVGFFFHFGRMWSLESIYDRIYFWRVALKMWLDNPVLGVSISAFQDVYKQIALSGEIPAFVAPTQQVFNYVDVMHAHNIVLMLGASTGLLGLISFFWLYFKGIRTIFSNLTGFRLGLTTWPVVFLVNGITGFNIYHSWYQAFLAFWLILIGTGDDAWSDVKS